MVWIPQTFLWLLEHGAKKCCQILVLLRPMSNYDLWDYNSSGILRRMKICKGKCKMEGKGCILWKRFSSHPKDIYFLKKVECCQSLLMHFVSDWWKCAAAPLSIFSLKRSFWHTMDGEYATNDNLNVKIDIYWQTHFAASAQAKYCSTFHCVNVGPSVYRRDISYFSNVWPGCVGAGEEEVCYPAQHGQPGDQGLTAETEKNRIN